jgi:hypothetical protein
MSLKGGKKKSRGKQKDEGIVILLTLFKSEFPDPGQN